MRIILCYIEAVADLAKFKAACRLAARPASRSSHKLGRSEAGKAAALAHTGSLAGAAAFDAVTAELA